MSVAGPVFEPSFPGNRFNFWEIIRTCDQAVTILVVVGSFQNRQRKSVFCDIVWWACLDSNQERDRYEQ